MPKKENPVRGGGGYAINMCDLYVCWEERDTERERARESRERERKREQRERERE